MEKNFKIRKKSRNREEILFQVFTSAVLTAKRLKPFILCDMIEFKKELKRMNF